MNQNKKAVEKLCVICADLACAVLALAFSTYVRYGAVFGRNKNFDQIWILCLVALSYLLCVTVTDIYDHVFKKGIPGMLAEVLEKDTVTAVSLLVLIYLLHMSSDLSRLVLGWFVLVDVPLSFAAHLAVKEYLLRVYRRGRSARRLLIVASGARADTIAGQLNLKNDWNRHVLGIALSDMEAADHRPLKDLPIVAGRSDLMAYAVGHEVDEVFFADHHLGAADDGSIISWLQELEAMGVEVELNIEEFDMTSSGQKKLGRVGDFAVVTVSRNIFSARQLVLKRMLDICGACVGLVFFGLAYVIFAPLIKLDSPGPVLFGQERIGKNGRRFTFYKFRSMYQDAEERKKALMDKNEVTGLMFKMEDDPRITRIGRFLRRTSIDELPQFYNILKGDMSLVGTRPPTADEYEKYEAKHKCRLSMTPGLTGMWQVSGRSDIKDFEEVVRLDMQYIDGWTIKRDIGILLKTVWIVLAGRGSR